MTTMLWRRSIPFASVINHHFFLTARCCFYSRTSTILDKENEKTQSTTLPNYSRIDGFNIELVDHDTWQISSGLAHAWRGLDKEMESKSLTDVVDEQVDDGFVPVEGDQDFDEIDNMRIRGNLFYKLDCNSKEFEEYSYDFHRKKCLTKKGDHKEREKKDSLKKKDNHKESKKKENHIRSSVPESENLPKIVKDERFYTLLGKMDSSFVEKKKLRTPTFNQLTGPYHEPFCLDIYISKASVRACIVHRVTSKVVAVAHSISRDIKFDLASTKNSTACAVVGGILAQRALADDIHDVIYTPRKGEKLEGKLLIVLQSIIDNGVNVKVKLKQRTIKKSGYSSTA